MSSFVAVGGARVVPRSPAIGTRRVRERTLLTERTDGPCSSPAARGWAPIALSRADGQACTARRNRLLGLGQGPGVAGATASTLGYLGLDGAGPRVVRPRLQRQADELTVRWATEYRRPGLGKAR